MDEVQILLVASNEFLQFIVSAAYCLALITWKEELSWGKKEFSKSIHFLNQNKCIKYISNALTKQIVWLQVCNLVP